MQYFEQYLNEYLLPVIVFALTFSILEVLKKIFLNRFKKLSLSTENKLDDTIYEVLAKTKGFFLFVVSVYFSIQFCKDATPRLREWSEKALILSAILQVGIWGSTLITYLLTNLIQKRSKEPSADQTTLNILGYIIKFLFYTALLLVLLNNFGINVSALVTGLGVGGIAVALAVQNILGDLFASLTIALDKPFTVGDYVVIGDLSGTIEHVGLKTTRLRSLTGEQLVFANTDMLQSRVRNFKRMKERRILFYVGVTYQISLEQLKLLPEWIKAIVEKQDQARFDRTYFHAYGASSLDFEVVYWVKSSEYSTYTEVHQNILFEIFKKLSEEKIEFAYPTQTIFLEK